MRLFEEDVSAPRHWSKYLIAGVKFLIIFYLASLGMGLFLMHHGDAWLVKGIIVGLLYLALIIYAAIQLIKKLPVPALMLAAPTIPLLMMIIVISLFPVLHFFDKQIVRDEQVKILRS